MTDCREGSATWATALRSLVRLGGSARQLALGLIPPISHADVLLWDKPWGADVPQPEIPSIACLPFQRTYFDFGTSHYRQRGDWVEYSDMWRGVGGVLAQSSHTDNSITGVPFVWATPHDGFTWLVPAGTFVWCYGGLEDRKVEFSPIHKYFLDHGNGREGAEIALRSSVERMLEVLTLLACGSIEVAPLDLNRAARKRIQRSRNGKAAHVVVMRTRYRQYPIDNPQARLDKMAAHNVRAHWHHVTRGPFFCAHPDKRWDHPTKGLGVSRFVPEHQRGEGTAAPRIRKFADALG